MRAEWDAKRAASPGLPLPKRWPTKPRKGHRCDASTGWHSGSFGEPLIDMCKNEAVETVLTNKHWHWPAYLCAEHVATVTEVIRNPRLHRETS